VPTLEESGLLGFDVAGWYAFLVPANTPATIVRKIHADTAAALADPGDQGTSGRAWLVRGSARRRPNSDDF
jgi:tripartite-type tricarboxylate transporter receptor subunit TctC